MTVRLYFWCVAGIVISIALPILRAYLPKVPTAGFTRAAVRAAWIDARPYVVTGAFSAVAAIVIIASAGDSVAMWGWQQALLAGYAWDSTFQKLSKP